jgi:hypothetical protein
MESSNPKIEPKQITKSNYQTKSFLVMPVCRNFGSSTQGDTSDSQLRNCTAQAIRDVAASRVGLPEPASGGETGNRPRWKRHEALCTLTKLRKTQFLVRHHASPPVQLARCEKSQVKVWSSFGVHYNVCFSRVRCRKVGASSV